MINLDRLADRDATTALAIIAEVHTEIRVNRAVAQQLDAVFAAYVQA
jgi:hypothetical protein